MVTKKVVTEQVPGLQQAPADGKFVVRKLSASAAAAAGDDTTATELTYTHELVLVIDGEDEYSVPLSTFDDGALNNASYQLLAKRRQELREKLFQANDEVELTA